MKKIILITLILPVMAIAQTGKLSKADKVYGLSKFWQEVNYNYVYLNRVDRTKWDSAYKALIPVVQETTSDYDYFRELQKFCATLKDGHTNIYMPGGGEFETMTTMFGDYRLFIQNIADKAVIVRVNQSKAAEIPLGSEVIEVNGRSTKEYLAKYVTPYISSSTDHVLKDWGINRLLMGRNGDKYAVKIRKPNGTVISLDLTHKTTLEKEVFPAFDAETMLLEFKWLENGTAYIALNSFGDPKINELFMEKLPEIKKAKSLIIDLRANGGGSTNIGTKILQYFTNDTLLYGSKNSTRQHTAAFKAWGGYTKPADTAGNDWEKRALLTFEDNFFHTFDYSPSKINLDRMERIVVPTAILIGHNTASAAEDFLIYADKQAHMVKIGQNSFGSTGQPYSFDLPGGGSARICTKKDTYPDGREFVGFGVKPDIEVIPTIKDYIEKKDPVISRAIAHLRDRSK
ncbi:MAG: peptidase S41 [Pedobacter sp.]|nr:MAG: peptidase S41 [Pedobacter sp.]